MKVKLNYMSALAICRSTAEQIKIETPKDEASGKFKGVVKVHMADEWQTVIDLDPLYQTEAEGVTALGKFVDKIKKTTPYVGQKWPKENGPVPWGFVVTGIDRTLTRPSEVKRGSNYTPPRRKK